MLATYQAKFVDNQIQWIDMPTNIAPNADIIVTVLPTEINDKQLHEPTKAKRQMPAILKGRGKTVGDIMDMSEMTDKQTPNNATSVGLGTKMASYFKEIPPAQSEEENLYIPPRHLDMELK